MKGGKNKTDYDIVKLYLTRSEKAISETDKKYGTYCLTVAQNILRNKADSEECVNDTYLKTWNSIPPHKPQRLSAYLGKITRNLAINRYKLYSAQKRGGGETELILSELENCLPSESTTEKAFDEILLTKSIESLLKEQSQEKRRVFLLRYWYAFPISEIATELNQSESKVTSTLFRLRNKLKEHLEKEGIFV